MNTELIKSVTYVKDSAWFYLNLASLARQPLGNESATVVGTASVSETENEPAIIICLTHTWRGELISTVTEGWTFPAALPIGCLAKLELALTNRVDYSLTALRFL